MFGAFSTEKMGTFEVVIGFNLLFRLHLKYGLKLAEIEIEKDNYLKREPALMAGKKKRFLS